MSNKGITVIVALVFATVAAPLSGQSAPRQGQGQRSRQSFEEFRKGILNDYSEFRRTLIDRYADFLNGEWHEYESYNGVKRDSRPKPRVAPSVERNDTPQMAEPASGNRPVISGKEVDDSHAAPECLGMTSLPQKDDFSGKQQGPAGDRRSSKNDGADEFDFYRISVSIPHIDFNITEHLYANNDYAAQWRSLQKDEVADRLLPHIKSLADGMGLNDYLTYRLINSYIDSRFGSADVTSRMAAVHYLLANLGYDARIATTGQGVPLLLIPFEQTIFSRTYMMIDGEKYYVFGPDGFNLAKEGRQSIMTCRLPEDIDHGRKMDLVLGELRIPYSPYAFEYECGPIHIRGEVNENLMPLLYHYPQMPVGDFARSNIQPELRQELSRQMKSQLEGLGSDDKVAALLKFMHTVFSYATDEEFHGFEKPYFLEETLYYPKNDCEDRAIFYTWFLWNALGKEAQLVSFPGHEAATVRLDNPVEGTCYDYKGGTYYISDPTYIGSRTGMIMPPYKDITPNIDFTFK